MTQFLEPMYFTPHPVEGTPAFNIPETQRNTTGGIPGRNVGLPEGVNRVMVEWMGTVPVLIRFARPGQTTSTVVKALQPNESWSAAFPTRAAGGYLWFSLEAPASEAEAVNTLAVTIIPGPPIGAGG